jgi:hypothetical protein
LLDKAFALIEGHPAEAEKTHPALRKDRRPRISRGLGPRPARVENCLAVRPIITLRYVGNLETSGADSSGPHRSDNQDCSSDHVRSLGTAGRCVGIGSWAYAVREREETGAGDRALTEAITKIAAAMTFRSLGTAGRCVGIGSWT